MKESMQNNISLDYKKVINWVTRKKQPKRKQPIDNLELRIVDLFCGCGGITSGIIEAACNNRIKPKIALAIDNNPTVIEIYKRNFGEYAKRIETADIKEYFPVSEKIKLTKKEVEQRDLIGKVDLLFGGPPCQGHSDLNNSTRRNDPRNALYLSCIQATKVLNPKFLLIENVPTVIHSKEDVIYKSKVFLAKLGYFHRELKIDFQNLGLPQTRKRHVIIASKNNKFISSISNGCTVTRETRLIDFISNLENKVDPDYVMFRPSKMSVENKKRVDYLFENELYDLPDAKRPNCHKEKPHSYKSNYGRLNYQLPAQTITSGFGSIGQGRYIHPTKRRTITPREAARIQGFPDDFCFNTPTPISEIRKMIANAVPPQLSFIFANYFIDEFIRKN